MNKVEALATLLEAFAMPNRYADALHLAEEIEALIILRINQALTSQSAKDSQP